MTARRRVSRLWRLTAAEWRHLLRAAGLLLRAKALHLRLDAPGIMARLRAPAPKPGRRAATPNAAIRWALLAVSRRLPWRSDCLVQALAGKMWLEAEGRDSALRLGARRDGAGDLVAHAWLTCGGEIVTGGRIEAGLAAFDDADGG